MEKIKVTNYNKELLKTQYEQLRSNVLLKYQKETNNSYALTLFLNQGMVKWLEVWLECTSPVYIESEQKQTSFQQNIPNDSHIKIVILLANMAINSRKEAKYL